MELYTRAVQSGAKPSKSAVAVAGNGGANGDPTDLSKMTPIEKKKEMARRRQQAQKEKARKVLYSYIHHGATAWFVRVGWMRWW